MESSSPFSPVAIRSAIETALNQEPILPADKRGALIVMATSDGARAAFAAKIGDHWQFDGEAEWHGGKVSAGVSVVASW